MTAAKKQELRLDPAIVMAMVEPLTVRVEKLRGGAARIPIDLPSRDGMASGLGWDVDSVLRIENFLIRECPGGGGGVYHVTVIDSGQPQKRHEWQFLADPRLHPEIPPEVPPMFGGPTMYQSQPKVPFTPMAQNPYWPYPQPPQAQPQPQPTPAPAPAPAAPPPVAVQAPPPSWPWYGPQTPISRGRSRDDEEDVQQRRRDQEERSQRQKDLEEKLRAAEERLRETERARAEADYKAQLDRIQQQAAQQAQVQQQQAQQQVEMLREELRRMAERVAQPAVDPKVEHERAERERAEKERDRVAAEARAERERMERKAELEAVNARFEKMMEQMARLAEAKQQPSGPDPAMLALQEQIRRQEEQFKAQQEEARRERERYEADRREAERRETERREREALREEMRRQEQAFKEQLLVMQQNANRGPDPVIQMMQESTRQQIDALKEVLRTQQTSTDKLSAYMMSPRDILAIANDKSNGIDTITKNVVNVFNDMFQTQRQLVEMAAQMTGGGESPTMRIVEQGLGRAAELAERYVKLKTAEATSTAKVQEAQINAQAQIYAQQQARMAEMAQREAAAAAAAARGAGGLNGAASQPIVTPPPTAPATGQGVTGSTEMRQPSNGAGSGQLPEGKRKGKNGAAPAESGGGKVMALPVRRLGKTDEEWFGQALGYVTQLREEVNAFLDGLKQDPPRMTDADGKPIGLPPDQAVDMLLRAVNYTIAQNEHIVAIDDLFMEKRFAELMDVLLPDAPQTYRDDCVNLLNTVAENSDGDDEDDEDDETGDEANA